MTHFFTFYETIKFERKNRRIAGKAKAGEVRWRRHPDLNRGITVLQTAALPLGYAAAKNGAGNGI
jgi:hypothetical protein